MIDRLFCNEYIFTTRSTLPVYAHPPRACVAVCSVCIGACFEPVCRDVCAPVCGPCQGSFFVHCFVDTRVLELTPAGGEADRACHTSCYHHSVYVKATPHKPPTYARTSLFTQQSQGKGVVRGGDRVYIPGLDVSLSETQIYNNLSCFTRCKLMYF